MSCIKLKKIYCERDLLPKFYLKKFEKYSNEIWAILGKLRDYSGKFERLFWEIRETILGNSHGNLRKIWCEMDEKLMGENFIKVLNFDIIWNMFMKNMKKISILKWRLMKIEQNSEECKLNVEQNMKEMYLFKKILENWYNFVEKRLTNLGEVLRKHRKIFRDIWDFLELWSKRFQNSGQILPKIFH